VLATGFTGEGAGASLEEVVTEEGAEATPEEVVVGEGATVADKRRIG
jgi:hypothetical protein